MNRGLTWTLLILGEAALAAVVVAAFWYQEWQYSLPTPRPAELHQPAVGEPISLASYPAPGKSIDAAPLGPVTLYHFFNPDCPCSRFNIEHVRDLIHRYGPALRVVAVLQTDDPPAARASFERLDLRCEVLVDTKGAIAQQMGVYSTPQGVVLDSQSRLYYRGNYNRSRYCTEPESEYVRLAIAACLAGDSAPTFDEDSTTARGCELPANVEKTRGDSR
jgi:hypothetical protein